MKLGTLKSRKSREAWVRGPSDKDATKTKKDATISKRMQPNKVVKEPIELSDELTDMHKAFCFIYINSYNATQSAIKAVYSVETAHVQGPRLLGNVRVATELKHLKSEMHGDLFMDATDLAREYMKMAFADVTDFVEFGSEEVVARDGFGEALTDDDGEEITYTRNFVNFKDSSKVDGRMIQEIKQGKDGVSFKLHDKQRTMSELSKRLLSVDELKVKLLQAQIDKLGANDNDEGPIEIMISRKGER